MEMTITASSYIDLLKQLRCTDISVPRISQGRAKLHTERWTMYRFLATFGDRLGFSYPIAIQHRDKPDFRIELPDRDVGAEITSAMPEEYARALVLREKFHPNAPIELDHFRWDGPRRTTKEILKILKESQSRLTGMGWVGDSVEREWACAISAALRGKSMLLNSKGFKRYQWNWLLVYDNIPQAALDLEAALKHLMSELKTVRDNRPTSDIGFNTLFVETHNQFVAVEDGKWSVTKIKNLWRKRGT